MEIGFDCFRLQIDDIDIWNKSKEADLGSINGLPLLIFTDKISKTMEMQMLKHLQWCFWLVTKTNHHLMVQIEAMLLRLWHSFFRIMLGLLVTSFLEVFAILSLSLDRQHRNAITSKADSEYNYLVKHFNWQDIKKLQICRRAGCFDAASSLVVCIDIGLFASLVW